LKDTTGSERVGWLKLHLQSCLNREVEVVMIRGEPVYGRLTGFSLDSKPPFIMVESNNSKIFINLFRVERIRVSRT